MGMIRINVVAPDEATAPNTGVITYSSENYNYDNGVFYVGASIIITTIILAVLPIILIRRHSIASVSSSLPVHPKKRSLLRFLVLALVPFGITFSGLMFLKNSVNFTLAQTMDGSLPVSSDDINVTVALKDEPIYLTIPDTITIEAPTLSGYNLSVYADGLDLVDKDNPNNKIASISPEADTLSENTWGISLTAPENQNTTTWKTVPLETDALTIKDITEATRASDTTTVYYGIYITPDLPYGTYTGTINYMAIANLVMQDVDMWGSQVEEGQEVFAIDKRDGKKYSVTRLKDGNLWMTQNLDHDIDSTRIYTPDDTDIPANWTPSTSTYTTGTTTWNAWNGSALAPESYDPGDLYWNGTPDTENAWFEYYFFDGDDPLPIVTSSTGDPHYHLGNYYNWTAAVAMNDSSSITDGTLVDQSICPAGWTLPRAGFGDDTFYALINKYDTWDSSTYTLQNKTQLWASPTYFSLSGNYDYGDLWFLGSNGYYWSSTAFDYDGGYQARGMHFGIDFTYPGLYQSNRDLGESVRCIARPVADTVKTTSGDIIIKTAEGIEKVILNGTECTSRDGCLVSNISSGATYRLEAIPGQGYDFANWNAVINGAIQDNEFASTWYSVGYGDDIIEPNAEPASARLDIGSVVNKKLKNLADNTTNAEVYTKNSTIKAFRRSNNLPDGFSASEANTISLSTSSIPIYAFFDNADDAGIMYYYAEDNTQIKLNTNSSSMFDSMTSLIDISGLANWNTANVTNMGFMFSHTKITNVDALANWNTAKVTNMYSMFSHTKITNVDALTNWDTSSVTGMGFVFSNTSSLEDISGLANWNTAKVTNMNGMFFYSKITNVDALANWDTSSVTSMAALFHYTSSLEDISGLANWNTAKVTDMSDMFRNSKITTVDALANWDTSSVTRMAALFYYASSLEDISGLANWNTANVTDMGFMFSYTKITNVDALANWDTSSVTRMESLFQGVSSLEDISGLANWNTAKVTDMSDMFRNSKITTVDALAPGKDNNPNVWNTGNVTDMSGTFYAATSLSDLSGITNWDVSKVQVTAGSASQSDNKFYMLFNHVPTSATSGFSFSLRPGSVSSNGTYVTSN